jgi:DoxX-like protein
MGSSKGWKIARIVGIVIHVLIGGLLIFAGVGKLMGGKEMVEALDKIGMGDKLFLIGAGELITGLLLIVPWTSKLGTLATSGFWGGVICIQMAHPNPGYIPFSVMLAVTWFASFLRYPEILLPVSNRPT